MQESLLMTLGVNSYIGGGNTIDVEEALKHIFSLKLECGSCVQGISTFMKRFGLKNLSNR